MLKYGYSVLESKCLRAINLIGPDAHESLLNKMTLSKNILA